MAANVSACQVAETAATIEQAAKHDQLNSLPEETFQQLTSRIEHCLAWIEANMEDIG